jgi:hypothetical protein
MAVARNPKVQDTLKLLSLMVEVFYENFYQFNLFLVEHKLTIW